MVHQFRAKIGVKPVEDFVEVCDVVEMRMIPLRRELR